MALAYITVRTKSTQPVKPILIVDYLPLEGIGAVRRVNTVTYNWDDSQPLITPRGRLIKLGAGIPNTQHTTVSIWDQGWAEDLPSMRGRLIEVLSDEVKCAMAGKRVLMQWIPTGAGTHPWAHVLEGDDHSWWEIRTVQVDIDRHQPSGVQMYR